MQPERPTLLDPSELFRFVAGSPPIARLEAPWRIVGCPYCGEKHFNNEPCPIEIRPVTLRTANEFVDRHHRHHDPDTGHRFSIGVYAGERLAGVAIVGRPKAPALDDGTTCEVTRCCTDGTPNAPSMLYAAAWRAARAMGYRRLVTYTAVSEPGTSLRAAGLVCTGITRGRRPGTAWGRPGRPGNDKNIGPKKRWELKTERTDQ